MKTYRFRPFIILGALLVLLFILVMVSLVPKPVDAVQKDIPLSPSANAPRHASETPTPLPTLTATPASATANAVNSPPDFFSFLLTYFLSVSPTNTPSYYMPVIFGRPPDTATSTATGTITPTFTGTSSATITKTSTRTLTPTTGPGINHPNGQMLPTPSVTPTPARH